MIYKSGITFGELTTFTSRVVSDSGIGHLIIRDSEVIELGIDEDIDLNLINSRVFTLDFLTTESIDSLVKDLSVIKKIMQSVENTSREF